MRKHERSSVDDSPNPGASARGAAPGKSPRTSRLDPGRAAPVQHSAAPGAAGAAVQRKDVTVTAGTGKTETESTTRVRDQGNQFEDQSDAWQKLVAWKKGTTITFASGGTNATRPPTKKDALKFFYELTPEQRNNVWHDREGVFSHICSEFSRDDAAQVMGMCDFPLKWKIYHWFKDIASVGAGRDILRSMISNSPLGQRLAAVKDEGVVAKLVTTFGNDHPENLFGDAIKTELYPDDTTATAFDKAHPTFAGWRNAAQKLDAEARWAFVGQSPSANIADLKSKNAMGGRTQWTSLLHWGPRGQALSPTMRANIDNAALDSSVSSADRADLFQTRWNAPLTDPGAPFSRVKEIWVNLQRMPLGVISSDVVTKVELRTNKSGGAYSDIPTSSGFGGYWVGTNASLTKVGHTTRHEVGHGADTKLGGFSNFSSKPPIVWKKWMTTRPWVIEMLGYMDAATSGAEGQAFIQLMLDALGSQAFTSPFGAAPTATGTLTPQQERAKLWAKAASEYNGNSQDIGKALDVLKTAGKHTAAPATIKSIVSDARASGGKGKHPGSEPSYVRDHYFLKKYGEHFSYHKTGAKDVWSNGNLRAYTLCSPYEFYADIFAAYFKTDTNRDANVPAWAKGYMEQLESMYDAKAADDPNNTRSTVYSTPQAPGAE